MKYVNFVRSLVIEKVPLRGRFEIHYHTYDPVHIVGKDDSLCLPLKVTEKVASIFHVCGVGDDQVYVAWSEEVEQFLGLPMRLMVQEKQELQSHVDILRRHRDVARNERDKLKNELHALRHRRLTFMQRLRCLFTGVIP